MKDQFVEKEIKEVAALSLLLATSCVGRDNLHVVMACLNIIYQIMESSNVTLRDMYSEMLYDTADFPYEMVKKELH